MGSCENELRENVPLKTGQKTTGCCSCNEDCLGGSTFINSSFATLTLVITVALFIQIYYGDYQVAPHGSAATDSFECSEIGTSILKKGGNSADAAIASAFCLAVVAPHLTSLDAQGQILMYNHRKRGAPMVIDFSNSNITSDDLPRLVLGLAYFHLQYASFSWENLVEPSVKVARNGFLVPKMLVQAISKVNAENLYGHLEAGQILKLEDLAITLERISKIPEEVLYAHVTPINRPLHYEAVRSEFGHYNVYVPNIPTTGPLLIKSLQSIEGLLRSDKNARELEYVHKVAELTQVLYQNESFYERFHHGTSTNVGVIDLDDNYVSLVMGMYTYFGSGEKSVDSYTLDVESKVTCSRLPVLIVDNNAICGRRIVFGANDPLLATQIIYQLLVKEENVTESAEAPRFIIGNGSLGVEKSHLPFFTDNDLMEMEKLIANPFSAKEPYYSSNIVEKFKDDLTSHSDSRGGGIASRF